MYPRREGFQTASGRSFSCHEISDRHLNTCQQDALANMKVAFYHTFSQHVKTPWVIQRSHFRGPSQRKRSTGGGPPKKLHFSRFNKRHQPNKRLRIHKAPTLFQIQRRENTQPFPYPRLRHLTTFGGDFQQIKRLFGQNQRRRLFPETVKKSMLPIARFSPAPNTLIRA